MVNISLPNYEKGNYVVEIYFVVKVNMVCVVEHLVVSLRKGAGKAPGF